MNRFLLDTNVPSELVRSRPEPRVVNWVYAQDEQSLYLNVVSLGELRRGFVLLPIGERRTKLEYWFQYDLLPRFEGRILPITLTVADRWGELDAQCQLKGRPLNTADGLIAATAIEEGMMVVTRNVKDFEGFGVPVLNPWEDVAIV